MPSNLVPSVYLGLMPAPPMTVCPAKITDARQIADLMIAVWRSAFVGLVRDDFLAGLDARKMRQRWHETLGDTAALPRTLVAKQGDQIVGFISLCPARVENHEQWGEVQALFSATQGSGIGHALMAAGAAYLAEQGYDRCLVRVLTQTPARAFYAHMGGQDMFTSTVDFGGKTLPVTYLGWESLGDLIGDKT